MNNDGILSASSAIIRKAKLLGADMAGFASLDDLISAPSFTFAPKMPGTDQGVGSRNNTTGLDSGKVKWPENCKSILVIAVSHPKESPEMDWWYGPVSPQGNKHLIKIIKDLCDWISETFSFEVFHFPYHIEKGGIYLKDAAVMAGLGCIGRNNMLVTPDFGPRVRLRALSVNVSMPSTGPIAFDPCRQCRDICRMVCPQKAFDRQVYTVEAYEQTMLPARYGEYSRPVCNKQMQKNISMAIEEPANDAGTEKPVRIIKYCRNCEMSCPVGKQS